MELNFPEPSEARAVAEDWEQIVPVRDQLLIRPDPPKDKTKSGIVLPDSVRIPTFRGRVIAVSYFLTKAWDDAGVPKEHQIRELDVVIFHYGSLMPADNGGTNPNVLVSVGNVLGKIQTTKAKRKEAAGV